MGKIVKEIETTKIDKTTGEITEHVSHTVMNLPQEPPFVKVYLDDIVRLYNLPTKSSETLYVLVRKMDYDGIITLTAAYKRRVAEQLGTSVSVIDNQLSRLTKTNLLTRIDRGEYMLDPNLFARGSWPDIRKLRDKYIELRISYDLDSGNRKISSELVNKKDKPS